jgi:histidinol-phosphate aminotransferase
MFSINREAQEDLLKRGFSRRNFGRISSMMAAAAALPVSTEYAMAQLSMLRGPVPADAVRINANENPLGPCDAAKEAIMKIVASGGRYQYEKTFEFANAVAEVEGLTAKYVQPYAGSSAPLHYGVIAFTSPTRGLVMADPGYEAAERAAAFIKAPVVKVPLMKEAAYKHDVKAMLKANPNAGVYYITNPNNPTGSVTPKADIEWLLANKPAGSIVLLDEAYIHLTDEPVATDLVRADKDIIILRTFSKIYGMAGLRAGSAIARPDLLEKMAPYGAGAHPITGMVAGTASLKDKQVIPVRKKIIGDVRRDTIAFLEKRGIPVVPSVSNKFMMDVKRPGQEFVEAMFKEKILIGRVWKAWPTHVRVSVGTAEEMDKFKTAVAKVLG